MHIFVYFLIFALVAAAIYFFTFLFLNNLNPDKIDDADESFDCKNLWGNYPHPTNPQAFYMCIGGNAVLVFCTTNYVFDFEAQQCVRSS
ncbi:chtBD2 [Artaxa digramma nucleopolyhedrovirus]|uniref:ChtBD2 n=1 Tax=Artaxa digramma nucleopolyhedrovirus TaxID=3070910 RepID=A0AAE6R642_9ABAC|nr:chtBD2 [Euproctis digramma nucleopolyhedrovirus]QHB21747.1 chtBD2 [Artaxa digramma nucleopolyhedrovirus]